MYKYSNFNNLMAFLMQLTRGISKYARITIINVCFIALTFAGCLKMFELEAPSSNNFLETWQNV